MIIPPGRGQVIFRMQDAELVSQLIEGIFPDLRANHPPQLADPRHAIDRLPS